MQTIYHKKAQTQEGKKRETTLVGSMKLKDHVAKVWRVTIAVAKWKTGGPGTQESRAREGRGVGSPMLDSRLGTLGRQ